MDLPAVVLTGPGTPAHVVAAADALAGLMPAARRADDGDLVAAARTLRPLLAGVARVTPGPAARCSLREGLPLAAPVPCSPCRSRSSPCPPGAAPRRWRPPPPRRHPRPAGPRSSGLPVQVAPRLTVRVRDPYGGLIARNRLFVAFSVAATAIGPTCRVAAVTWTLDGAAPRRDEGGRDQLLAPSTMYAAGRHVVGVRRRRLAAARPSRPSFRSRRPTASSRPSPSGLCGGGLEVAVASGGPALRRDRAAGLAAGALEAQRGPGHGWAVRRTHPSAARLVAEPRRVQPAHHGAAGRHRAPPAPRARSARARAPPARCRRGSAPPSACARGPALRSPRLRRGGPQPPRSKKEKPWPRARHLGRDGGRDLEVADAAPREVVEGHDPRQLVAVDDGQCAPWSTMSLVASVTSIPGAPVTTGLEAWPPAGVSPGLPSASTLTARSRSVMKPIGSPSSSTSTTSAVALAHQLGDVAHAGASGRRGDHRLGHDLADLHGARVYLRQEIRSRAVKPRAAASRRWAASSRPLPQDRRPWHRLSSSPGAGAAPARRRGSSSICCSRPAIGSSRAVDRDALDTRPRRAARARCPSSAASARSGRMTPEEILAEEASGRQRADFRRAPRRMVLTTLGQPGTSEFGEIVHDGDDLVVELARRGWPRVVRTTPMIVSTDGGQRGEAGALAAGRLLGEDLLGRHASGPGPTRRCSGSALTRRAGVGVSSASRSTARDSRSPAASSRSRNGAATRRPASMRPRQASWVGVGGATGADCMWQRAARCRPRAAGRTRRHGAGPDLPRR